MYTKSTNIAVLTAEVTSYLNLSFHASDNLVNGQSAFILILVLQVIEGLHILEKWYGTHFLSTFEKKLTELVLFSDQP